MISTNANFHIGDVILYANIRPFAEGYDWKRLQLQTADSHHAPAQFVKLDFAPVPRDNKTQLSDCSEPIGSRPVPCSTLLFPTSFRAFNDTSPRRHITHTTAKGGQTTSPGYYPVWPQSNALANNGQCRAPQPRAIRHKDGL